ncbi:phospho-sugar mutase [Kallipyga massiliensis]|uniref:phospho-sugar mutase n=1 Tax=Kallipyga massiliensis TaxID=1472764 RepID=UPI0004BC6E62|nr:phospho-sugar mutase [Kallipyga massiliensis]
MDYKNIYRAWLEDPSIDEASKEELRALEGNEEEIKDRFYTPLAFGTAGLRGKLGAGTNRMNMYTVGAACEGLARFIESQGQDAKDRGVSIAYDVRHFSKEFSILSAEILAAHGIHVYIHTECQPTPLLSYTVRKTDSFAGIMVTASHNPKEYNGYKVYNDEGSQILDDWAKAIESEIGLVISYGDIKRLAYEEGKEQGLIEEIAQDLIEDYIQDILELPIHDQSIDKNIKIVYSPLNGAGNKLVRRIFRERGFDNIHIVKEQENPDPDFTTIGYPNPEDPKAFALSEKLGKEVGADLLFATDPDSDRCALEVRNSEGDFVFFDGNKVGALIGYYIISERQAKGTLPENGAVLKSIVTGDLLAAIAEDYGVECFEVLTGFKNIAAPVNEWDETGEFEYLYGFEESIGYNPSKFVRDKDAVSSAMMIAEMAAFYRAQGKSLLDVLDELYEEYGYYNNRLKSTVLEGIDGKEKINRIMEEFRANPLEKIADMTLDEVIDYERDDTGLPKSNVLRYFYDDGSWYAIRPSGTEPKIKVYMYSVGEDLEDSERKLTAFENATDDVFASVQ